MGYHFLTKFVEPCAVPLLNHCYKIVDYGGVHILNRHLSGKFQKFVLCWCNVGPIHGCGWTNILDVGPALIQHVLTVMYRPLMYCICWAHNRTKARTIVGLIWGQCHRRSVNIRTTSRRDITNLWSLYPASQQTRDIVECPNDVTMLVHCLRCWLNIEQTMGQCIVFAGLNEPSTPVCFTHGGSDVLCNISVPANTTH